MSTSLPIRYDSPNPGLCCAHEMPDLGAKLQSNGTSHLRSNSGSLAAQPESFSLETPAWHSRSSATIGGVIRMRATEIERVFS
jgi:hypothetical protein